MIFNPTLSRKELDERFSKLRKLNYNQFRWWRMYDNPNPPLHDRQPLRDKILNGDFDYSHYGFQAQWCEHEMNDIWGECKPDIGKYNEKTAVLKARRKRLLEDFEKDEANRLSELVKAFTRSFKCNEDQVWEEMENCSGSLIDLYYIIEEKYKIIFTPYPTKRGRPRKI